MHLPPILSWLHLIIGRVLCQSTVPSSWSIICWKWPIVVLSASMEPKSFSCHHSRLLLLCHVAKQARHLRTSIEEARRLHLAAELRLNSRLC